VFGRDWEPAEALVIKADQLMSMGQYAGFGSVKMILEVRPATAEPFRAQVEVNQQGSIGRKRQYACPQVGTMIPVEFLAKSHKVRVVVGDDQDRRVLKERKEEAWDEIAAQPAGTPTAVTELPAGIEELLKDQLGLSGNVVMNIETIDLVPGSPPPFGPGSVTEELGQLAALHAAGVLNEAEFEAAKSRLLG
jgi:hypothetical protein